MRKIKLIGALATLLLMSACNEGTQFVRANYIAAGIGANNSSVSITPTPTPVPTDTPSATPTDPVAATVIELLTPQIINNAADQHLQFRVRYEGTPGNPSDFPVDEMLFDIASTAASEIRSLDYKITVSNSLEYQGQIDPVWGEDLFGNVGSNYFHFATDQLIDIPAGITWFTFDVDLSYSINHPYGSTAPHPASEQIQVYVKFGHDSMLASAPVTFINQ